MPIVTIVTISKQGGLSFVYSCSTICYVNTTLKAQPFLLNTGQSGDSGQSGDRTDEDPLKETQTTDGPMDDGTDTHLKG